MLRSDHSYSRLPLFLRRVFLYSLIATSVFTSPAFAEVITPGIGFDENNILFYDPCSSGMMGGMASGGAIGTASLSGSRTEFMEAYHDIAEQLSIQYGIPWEAVMAQGIIESASGTSRFARERNNFFGIRAFDNNPNAATTFSTPEAGWRGYYEFINTNSRYRNHGAFNHAGDPIGYLQAIKSAGYATAPDYVQTVGSVANSVTEYAKSRGWKTSAELLAENPSMGQGAGSGSGVDTSIPMDMLSGVANQTCANGSSVADFIASGDVGSLQQLVLDWAWETYKGRGFTTKKAAYEAMLADSAYKGGSNGVDCGAFVYNLMVRSGWDPNYAAGNTSVQNNYLRNNWVDVTNQPRQPGDVAIRSGHVKVYVGNISGFDSTMASASLGTRAPMADRESVNDSRYRWYRKP